MKYYVLSWLGPPTCLANSDKAHYFCRVIYSRIFGLLLGDHDINAIASPVMSGIWKRRKKSLMPLPAFLCFTCPNSTISSASSALSPVLDYVW